MLLQNMIFYVCVTFERTNSNYEDESNKDAKDLLLKFICKCLSFLRMVQNLLLDELHCNLFSSLIFPKHVYPEINYIEFDGTYFQCKYL